MIFRFFRWKLRVAPYSILLQFILLVLWSTEQSALQNSNSYYFFHLTSFLFLYTLRFRPTHRHLTSHNIAWQTCTLKPTAQDGTWRRPRPRDHARQRRCRLFLGGTKSSCHAIFGLFVSGYDPVSDSKPKQVFWATSLRRRGRTQSRTVLKLLFLSEGHD